jgi:hypothetical protein
MAITHPSFLWKSHGTGHQNKIASRATPLQHCKKTSDQKFRPATDVTLKIPDEQHGCSRYKAAQIPDHENQPQFVPDDGPNAWPHG